MTQSKVESVAHRKQTVYSNRKKDTSIHDNSSVFSSNDVDRTQPDDTKLVSNTNTKKPLFRASAPLLVENWWNGDFEMHTHSFLSKEFLP